MPAVIFDLDGVLVDSSALFENKLKEALDRNGYHISIDEVKKARGPNVEQWVDSLLPQNLTRRVDRVRELSARVRHAVAELSGQLTLHSDARKVLSAVAANHHLFLLTNSSSRYTKTILAKHNIEELFKQVITSSDDFESKEDALAYLSKTYAKMPRDLTYVGDAIRDVICAKNAGCRVIIVYTPWSWDYGRLREIEAARPDAIVDRLDAVVDVLDKGSK